MRGIGGQVKRAHPGTGISRPARSPCLFVSLSLCLLVSLSLLTAGCDLPGRPDPADRPVPADQVMDFGTLYATNCAGCHGADGKLGPAPPLNDPIFLAIVPDAELLRVITEGRNVTPAQKTPMPAFQRDRGGPLTASQVKALAVGIKARWGSTQPEVKSVPPYLAPDSRSANKEEGAQVFARACASCHGSQGRGGSLCRASARLTTRRSWRSSAIRHCAATLSPAGPTLACRLSMAKTAVRLTFAR